MKTKWPWWLSLLLAVIVYPLLKYGLSGSPLAKLAPLATIGWLLLAAKQLYDGDPPPLPPPDDTTNHDDTTPQEEVVRE